MRTYTLLFALVFLLFACSGERDAASLPQSIGGEYEIVVLVDNELTGAPHVDALNTALTKEYPSLNQPEPWFSITWFDVDDVNDYTLKGRYIILLSTCEPGNKVTRMAESIFGKEKTDQIPGTSGKFYITGSHAFANPQNIMYLNGNSTEELAESISQQGDNLLNYFGNIEAKRIKDGLFRYRRKVGLETAIKNEIGAEMLVPTVYEPSVQPFSDLDMIYKRLDITGFKWIYSNARHSFSNVAVWSMPYRDTSQLDLENILDVRDSVLKYFIPCETEGSYMGTERRYSDVYPKAKVTELNGSYAIELSGLWAAVNGYQGGPFVGYVVIDEENGRLVFIDGSVAAKGQPKKKYIVRLKAILSTLKV